MGQAWNAIIGTAKMEKSGTRCKCISLLESKVQAPLTATCEDAAADDEHSDTDDEDQYVEYQDDLGTAL